MFGTQCIWYFSGHKRNHKTKVNAVMLKVFNSVYKISNMNLAFNNSD